MLKTLSASSSGLSGSRSKEERAQKAQPVRSAASSELALVSGTGTLIRFRQNYYMAYLDGATPDAVVQDYAARGVEARLTVRPLEEGFQLLEGDRDTLLFLADLLRAVATTGDCGFQISPTGAGSQWFGPGAEAGLYLHRTPCTNHE